MVLDRSSGAILTTTGTLSSSRNSVDVGIPTTLPDDSSVNPKENHGVEEMAAMVWNFVKSTGGLIQAMDEEVSETYYRTYNSMIDSHLSG